MRKNGISFTKYRFIDRWATDYLFNANSMKGIVDAKYPVLKVKNFLSSFQYGLSLRATEEPIGIPMLRMNNIVNSELNIADLKYIKIDKSQKEKFLLEKEIYYLIVLTAKNLLVKRLYLSLMVNTHLHHI